VRPEVRKVRTSNQHFQDGLSFGRNDKALADDELAEYRVEPLPRGGCIENRQRRFITSAFNYELIDLNVYWLGFAQQMQAHGEGVSLRVEREIGDFADAAELPIQERSPCEGECRVLGRAKHVANYPSDSDGSISIPLFARFPRPP